MTNTYLSSNNVVSLSFEDDNVYKSILNNWKSYSQDEAHQWKFGISWQEIDVLYKKRAYFENELKYIAAKTFVDYINLSYLLLLY